MKSSVSYRIHRGNIVPQGAERVAWLDAHGVIPEETEIEATAELADWAAAGFQIEADGSVRWGGCLHYQASGNLAVESAIATRLRLDPTCLDSFDAAEMLQATARLLCVQDAERLAQKAADESERLAKAAVIQAAAAYAQTLPLPANILRAAREGLDVREQVCSVIVARLDAAIPVVDGCHNLDDDEWCNDTKLDERIPSELAYAQRDALEAAIPELAKLCPPDARFTVEPCEKVDVGVGSRSKIWRSSVGLRVDHDFFGGRSLMFRILTEPLNWTVPSDSDE